MILQQTTYSPYNVSSTPSGLVVSYYTCNYVWEQSDYDIKWRKEYDRRLAVELMKSKWYIPKEEKVIKIKIFNKNKFVIRNYLEDKSNEKNIF